MKRLNNIAFPSVAEEMAERAGFETLERGSRVSMIEWPDAELAWRGLSSIGPAVPALLHSDSDTVKGSVRDAPAHCRDQRGAYRFENHHFVIARRPT